MWRLRKPFLTTTFVSIPNLLWANEEFRITAEGGRMYDSLNRVVSHPLKGTPSRLKGCAHTWTTVVDRFRYFMDSIALAHFITWVSHVLMLFLRKVIKDMLCLYFYIFILRTAPSISEMSFWMCKMPSSVTSRQGLYLAVYLNKVDR